MIHFNRKSKNLSRDDTNHVSNSAYIRANVLIFLLFLAKKNDNGYTLIAFSGCSAVGSAPRLGRGGPRFESAHPDFSQLNYMIMVR